MDEFRRFRLMAVRLGLGLTLIATIGAYWWAPVAGKAVLGGGIAGVLAFWITARRMEKLAEDAQSTIYSVSVKWAVARLALYVVTLYWGYRLDPQGYVGLFAAGAGLLLIRVAVILLGLTGLDLTQGQDRHGRDR